MDSEVGYDGLKDSHDAVENEDISLLRDLLDAGVDIEGDAGDGWTLLRHALDVEDEPHDQGRRLHIDMTVFLLARGADPRSVYNGLSVLESARIRGNWLAVEIIESFLERDRPRE